MSLATSWSTQVKHVGFGCLYISGLLETTVYTALLSTDTCKYDHATAKPVVK